MKNYLWKIIKKLIPISVKIKIKTILYSLSIALVHVFHRQAIRKIKKKKKLKVAFFLVHSSVWKYDQLYWLLKRDNRFEPIIVLCPYIAYDKDTMFNEMTRSYNTFSKHGYSVLKTYNEQTNSWLDVKKELQPDIVFFTNPYETITRPEYSIGTFKELITCYVPYGFMITDRPQMQYNQLLHNYVFRIFHESEFHKSQACKFARNKGINSFVTGYPGLDSLMYPDNKRPDNVWKNEDTGMKRIIWAPHHSIETEDTPFNYSSFLQYCNLMLELASKYEDKICFSFKPHPILKAKLKALPDWGEERTEKYYSMWESMPNCQLNENDYTNLFLSSDAMIHDSGSFLVEYISCNKPSLYLVRSPKVLTGFSKLGDLIVDCHYKACSKIEIIRFIEDVVLKNEDTLEQTRKNIIDKYLKNPDGKKANQIIFEEVCNLVS